MTESYTPVPSSKPGLIIKFYGKQPFETEPKEIPLEQPITCEEVCIKCAEHLSKIRGKFFRRDKEKIIGPLFLPLFGLYAADHSLQQWVSDAHVFHDVGNLQEFYFRVRIRPIKNPEGICSDYLFSQIAEDFLTGTVWSLFREENKIKDVDSVNKNAYKVLIAAASYRLRGPTIIDPTSVLYTPLDELSSVENVTKKVSFLKRPKYMPAMPKDLQKEYDLGDPSMRWWSCHYIQKYIKGFFEKSGKKSLQTIRRDFVDAFLQDFVPNYLLEYFSAEKLEGFSKRGGQEVELPPSPVELFIRVHQDNGQAGLFTNTRFQAGLPDIFSAVMEMRSDQKCRIQLNFTNMSPMFLLMPSQEAADSFLSKLEIYCRLKVNYYESLSEEQLAAPSLRVMKLLNSFGPMEHDDARHYLQQDSCRSAEDGIYIIYQDTQKFHLFHAVGLDRNGRDVIRDITYEADNTASGFRFEVAGSRRPFVDEKELKLYLNTALGKRLYPKGDPCGAMHFLKEVDVYAYPTTETSSRRSRGHDLQGDRPLGYREDEISVTDADCIVHGQFSDIYCFTQMEDGREAILKKVTDKRPEVQESYRKGADRLLKLREATRSPFFLRVCGYVITSPVRFVFESMPTGQGSLLKRLRDSSDPSKVLPLNWMQVASVLSQLASCLNHLNKVGLVYGSLCCDSILIKEETDSELIIRLGDPSLSIYLDTLPDNDMLNQNRMAKECIKDMQGGKVRLSSMTDVWSFGVLLWEIFSAKNPENEMSRPDLGNDELRVADLKRKYLDGYRLPTPLYCPERVYNIMSRCWHDIPEARPTFAELTCELEPLSENDLS